MELAYGTHAATLVHRRTSVMRRVQQANSRPAAPPYETSQEQHDAAGAAFVARAPCGEVARLPTVLESRRATTDEKHRYTPPQPQPYNGRQKQRNTHIEREGGRQGKEGGRRRREARHNVGGRRR